jgi:4-diphosphocytidyl-2-C-methyl-D-erythritol kinase
MIIFPNSKLNLGLSITEKREDNFHNIETVLHPLPLKDVLEIIPAKTDVQFEMTGINIGGKPKDNLVMKAYEMINRDHPIGPVKIHLHKIIPAGAGLGGGSSDAAHTIKLLNTLYSLGLTEARMEEYARKLGSDCAFFIRNTPTLALGKGDQFKPVHITIQKYDILLVKPALNINTAEAYSWVRPHKKASSLHECINLPVHEWMGNVNNDFEGPVFERHPQLAEIKASLLKMNAVYASMTGSGSAVFGLFERESIPAKGADFPGCFVWKTGG